MSTADVAKLLPGERQQRIRQLLLEHGVLRINELAEQFSVSDMTIRRDLEVLEEAGHLERTFGGAIVSDQAAFESSYAVRLNTRAPQKQAIASYAKTLIQEGDTIALDASTTALALAREITKQRVTIITNSLDIALELRSATARVILTGGYLRQVAGSFAGPLAVASLARLRVDQAFISAKAVSVQDGLMDSDLDEAEVKRAMMRSAAKVTALLDTKKYGKRALGRICSLDALDLIISDAALDTRVQQALTEQHVHVQLVPVTTPTKE